MNRERPARYECWVGGCGAMVLFDVHPDGALFLWQPLNVNAGTVAKVEVVRDYMGSPPQKPA
jgi:hypothetical protein